LPRLAEKQHQQVTSAVTRVLVGQAQLYHCNLPQSKVTLNWAHGSSTRAPNGCGFAKLQYSEGGWGFACQCFSHFIQTLSSRGRYS